MANTQRPSQGDRSVPNQNHCGWEKRCTHGAAEEEVALTTGGSSLWQLCGEISRGFPHLPVPLMVIKWQEFESESLHFPHALALSSLLYRKVS